MGLWFYFEFECKDYVREFFGMGCVSYSGCVFIHRKLVFTFFLKKTELKKMVFYSRRLLGLDDLGRKWIVESQENPSL